MRELPIGLLTLPAMQLRRSLAGRRKTRATLRRRELILSGVPRAPVFCRVHGDPLVLDLRLLDWQCPSYSVCGTHMTDEFAMSRGAR